MHPKNSKLVLASLLASAIYAPFAAAYTINDNYIGSDSHGYGDVIGALGSFQISGADVSFAGSVMTVSIATTFAGKGDDKLFASLTDTAYSKVGGVKQGIGYGDLFLDNDWTPFGAAPYAGDNYANGTKWEYVLAVDNRWSSTGGVAKLYALSANDPGILLSNNFLSGGTFRNGQEVGVDVAKLADSAVLATGAWSVDAGTQRVNFSVNLAGTNILSAGNLALSWGMTCANDVLEGETSFAVPESGGLPLMAIGGLFLPLARRMTRQGRAAV